MTSVIFLTSPISFYLYLPWNINVTAILKKEAKSKVAQKKYFLEMDQFPAIKEKRKISTVIFGGN